mmetsp:Transcript_60861/g.145008  ORF Transcript_60861/g.145008 Transcript_60861/m.145008 type:complete len:219 (+) Transcript_60861:305-961(+)
MSRSPPWSGSEHSGRRRYGSCGVRAAPRSPTRWHTCGPRAPKRSRRRQGHPGKAMPLPCWRMSRISPPYCRMPRLGTFLPSCRTHRHSGQFSCGSRARYPRPSCSRQTWPSKGRRRQGLSSRSSRRRSCWQSVRRCRRLCRGSSKTCGSWRQKGSGSGSKCVHSSRRSLKASFRKRGRHGWCSRRNKSERGKSSHRSGAWFTKNYCKWSWRGSKTKLH